MDRFNVCRRCLEWQIFNPLAKCSKHAREEKIKNKKLNQSRLTIPEQRPTSFLDLPGEIRNRVYRLSLIFDRPFEVKVPSGSFSMPLLLANKQIYAEASSIFYQENAFEISYGVIDIYGVVDTKGRLPSSKGEFTFIPLRTDLLTKLENIFCLPQWRLATLQHLSVEIPVYSGYRLAPTERAVVHSAAMARFLATTKGPRMYLHVSFLASQRKGDLYLPDPRSSQATLQPWIEQQCALRTKGEFHIVVQAHPLHLDMWAETKERWFGRTWSVSCILKENCVEYEKVVFGHYVTRFREQNLSILEQGYYVETWNDTSYLISLSPKLTVDARNTMPVGGMEG